MAISKETKEKRVAQFESLFSDSKAVVFADYRGLKMGDLNDLRKRLRQTGATFHVTKNTLAIKAMDRLGRTVPEEFLTGPTGVAFLFEDVTGGVKVLVDYARETKILSLKGGLLGDRPVAGADLEPLATLPPREVLLAQLLGSMQAPLARLAGALNAPLRQLGYALQSRKEQLEKAAA